MTTIGLTIQQNPLKFLLLFLRCIYKTMLNFVSRSAAKILLEEKSCSNAESKKRKAYETDALMSLISGGFSAEMTKASRQLSAII